MKPTSEAQMKAYTQAKENERPVHSIKQISEWRGLSGTERDILMAIRQHMRTHTIIGASKGWRWTTDKQIAEDTGLSTKTVRRTLKGLIAKKVVEENRPHKPAPGIRVGFAIHKQACCFKTQ
jgi:DNA-binding MarR family transcriptional regulator